jgi:hypothetical protein
MPSEQNLQIVVDQLKDMASSVAANKTMPSPDLRRVLRFITKVVQVVDQAFRDVYATLIDVKYLTLEATRDATRLQQIQRDVELLRARDRYRDAEQICTRLHELRQQYDREIAPLVAHLDQQGAWAQVFRLLDGCEGEIINLVNGTIRDLEQMLRGPFDERKVASITQLASAKVEAIRSSLLNLEAVQNRILGLSGTQGMLELTETDRDALRAQVNLFVQDNSVTHGHRVDARGASGQVAVGSRIRQTRKSAKSEGLTAAEVLAIVEKLKTAISEEIGESDGHSRAIRQLDEVKTELKESSPNKEYVAATIRKATEVVRQSGGLVTASTKLGKLLVPLAGWLGKSLSWFGL